MTRDEFTRTAIALLRSAVGWQSAIARRLEVDSRTVRRWLAHGIPDWAAARLAELIGSTDIAASWPRDEWIVGQGPDLRREYIVHTMPPRFIARVAGEDDTDADEISGIVYASGEDTLCEILWLDEPDPGAVTALLEAACDALDAQAEATPS